MPSVVWFTHRGDDGTLVHNWPSNFYIEQDGTFVEAEFQAAKHEGHPWRQAIILNAKTPYRAKQLGRKWKLTEDELIAWNERRVDVMLELIQKKVDDWGYIRQQLYFTDGGQLVENNHWHDNFWGNCTCLKCFRNGQNWLGETWMEVRRTIDRQTVAGLA
jgi:ribA/ribD-fused uncharacterized protein